jgi:glycogen(starch) synthase
MRILHMTTEFPPVVFGGLGTAVGGLVHALAEAGDTMGVLLVGGSLAAAGYGKPAAGTVTDRPVDDGHGITFFQIPWDAPAGEAARVVREWRPDVVHLHTAWIWPFAETVVETGTPVIYTAHSVDRAEYEIGMEPGHILEHSDDQGRAVASVDRLIALTRDEADLLVHYYPEATDRIRIVGNGIDDSKEARRAAQRTRSGSPLVLYTGRLVERKGIRDLLAAIPAVLEQAPDTRFVLAGGPAGCPGADLRGQWLPPECLPWADRIHFTGWLTMQEVEEWYRRADIQVIPSRYEPFGMVVLEGMLHGLPIVATNVGGPAAILEDGRTGLLIPPFDPEALAAALLRLLGDPELRRCLGAEAAAEVRRTWLWSQRAQRMRAVYLEAAAWASRAERRACASRAAGPRPQ